MNVIKGLLRKALLKEGAHKASKYGCVMVFLNYNKSQWTELVNAIDDEDLYEPEGETGYGRETEPHVTILYGLHADIEDEDIEEVINDIEEPKLRLGKVSAFKNKNFEVLKFDVESSDLHSLNKEFTKFPYTTDYPDYHPHCTIAYVKVGTADKYIDKLNKIGKINVGVDKIVYSKSDGTKKSYNPF